MSSSKVKKSISNIVISFSSQMIIMVLGFILPRLMITGFGSEVNGFFSTVTQLYSYLEVLRAGVGMAAIQALYKPIVEKDETEISKVISSSRKYFNNLGYAYLICTFILACGFVLFGNVSLSNLEVFLIVIMQGLSGWLSFSMISWFVDLLRAEGKNYVFITVQSAGRILIQLTEIILIYKTRNPVLVKSASLIFVFLMYLTFNVYRKKSYSRINFHSIADMSLLKNRRSYLVFHVTDLICTNTDIIVLSLFCGYEVVSVYAVYYLVVSGVNAIINTIYSSTAFLLGHAYQLGLVEFKKTHDTYYLVYTTLTTALFSVCYLMMIPFVRLYISGVNDVNYIFEYLPILFCLIQILNCGKNVGNITINLGGYAKKVVWRAMLEAGINLFVSIVLVQYIGIYGVLIGTILALGYRFVDVIVFSNKYVLKRSPNINIFMLLINIAMFFTVVIFGKYINIVFNSYWDVIKCGIMFTPAILIAFSGIILLIYKKEARIIINLIKKKIKRIA